MAFLKKKIGAEDDDLRVEKFDKGSLEKKIVFLEIDDEVTTAYDRIKRVRGEAITIVIPKHAALLRSIVNLKILKRKMDDLGKKVVIVTNDPIGKKLAEQAGFEVVERTKFLTKEEKTSPIAYTPSAVASATQRPTKFSKQKTSISDVLQRGKKAAFPFIAKIKEYLLRRKKKKKYATEITIITPNKGALITLVVISVFVLAAIAYIALPGATITLTPASQRIEQPLNITLLDFEKFGDVLESRPESVIPSFRIKPPPIKKTFTYSATGKIFQGEHSRGIITITNESGNPWPLVEKTRFQTQDGLVFRIQEAVTVPPSHAGTPGTLDVTIVADPYDTNGQIIGERGNIAPTKFFLPGLKNLENQKKLYGVSHQPFTGGFTKVIKSISEDDLASATDRAKKEITIFARDELKRYLDSQNLERGTTLTFLEDSRTIFLSEPKITIPENQLGQEREIFEVMAEVEISGIAVNQKELLNLLRAEMNLRKSPDRNIVRIDNASFTYKIFDIEENASTIKLTATLRGIEQYDLDPHSEIGLQFLKKITDHVVGKDLDEATFYIQNLPEIERVEIKSWPFWAPTIPTVPDNIQFEIRSGFEETTD